MDEKPEHKSEADLSHEENSERVKQPHSRRAFLKGLGAAGVAAPFMAIATSAAARSKPRIPDVLSNTHSQVLDLNDRRDEAFNKRLGAAVDDHGVKVPPHPTNGDEPTHPSGIAN